MTFSQEVNKAMAKISDHIDSLMSHQERLDEEYDSLFHCLLERTDEFDANAVLSLKKLGRLRMLSHLNLSTIRALQHLRVCLQSTTYACCVGTVIDPSPPIDQLRRINEALTGSPRSQVKKLECAIELQIQELVGRHPSHADAIEFALAAVDEDVARIFGDAVRNPAE